MKQGQSELPCRTAEEHYVRHAVCRPRQQSAPCAPPAPGPQTLTGFLSITPTSSLCLGWVPRPSSRHCGAVCLRRNFRAQKATGGSELRFRATFGSSRSGTFCGLSWNELQRRRQRIALRGLGSIGDVISSDKAHAVRKAGRILKRGCQGRYSRHRNKLSWQL